MPTLRKISSKECIKILCNKFSFSVVRQKGSHVVLRKQTEQRVVGMVVPVHAELKIGTLKAILEQAQITEEEFMQFI